jgi:hypothetical protein
MNRRSRYFSFLLVLVALAVAAPADVKVKTKNTAAGHSSESTVYIKGARQRDENPQMPFATILQCDQKRMLQVNDKCKVYMVTPLAAEEEPAAAGQGKSKPAAQPAKSTTKGGVVTYTTTMTDTKERKTMLGFPARHIKSSMTAESSPDACTKTSMRSETDGWYADLSVGLTCSRASARPMNPMAMEKPECQDEYRMKRVGAARLGYPLQQTATVHTENGDFSSSTEAVEISKDPLDAALFDVGAEYREVTSYQELMCMPSRQSMSAPAATPSAVPSRQKRAGVLLIGVVGFDNKSGREISLENMRQRLMGHFTEMNVDTVPLDKTTDAEIHEEATGKHCDYVLYTNLSSINQSAQAKVGGFFGKATGAGSGRGGKFESKVDFRLYPIADHPDKANLVSNASVKEDKDAEETTADALQKESQEVMEQVGKDAAKRGRP